MDASLDEIKRSLGVLFQPGDTIELRCVGDRPINGYYRDPQKLAADAHALSSNFNPLQNCYVCLNPIDPQLFARRADQFGYARKGESVKDHDVRLRRWLLIDADAIRPAGVSATSEQKQAAEKLAGEVYTYLAEQIGSSSIVCGDSGNGAHMLLRLPDAPNSGEAAWVCDRLLQLLDQRFSNSLAKIDTSTSNAARICTLYGTIKRKGSDIAEQPHRQAKLVRVPEPLLPADWQKLAALVDAYPGDQQRRQAAQPAIEGSGWNIEQLLEQRQIEYSCDTEYRTTSGELATRYVLDVCPWHSEHDDRSAYIVQWRSGAIAAGCQHDSCQRNGWPELKQLWALPPAGGITAADIVLPAMSPMSQPAYSGAVSPMSPMSHESLQLYIDPPAAAPAAFHGPLGLICRELEQYTEAAPIAVLACSLMYFGNTLGRSFYARLDEPHFPKLYIALVGPTGAGRKGTADSQAQRIIDAISPLAELYRHSGLSTGEGLLQVLDQNRDGMYPRPAAFTEREFASVFRRAERKGNTLNGFIRDSWDDKPLANSSAGNPLRIANHHISICAHVTPAELKRLLTSVDVANGFSNRFCWLYCRRTGRRPNAVGFQPHRYRQQLDRLESALESAQQEFAKAGESIEIPFAPQAAAAWQSEYYPQLDIDSEDDSQLVLMVNRQAQQTVRLALIYALADNRRQIELVHLQAGRAVVEYVRDSLDYILSRRWWGDAGNAHDPAAMAPKVLQALHDGPKQRSQILHEVFQRHRTAAEINQVRDLLVQQGRLRVETDGRTEVWHGY